MLAPLLLRRYQARRPQPTDGGRDWRAFDLGPLPEIVDPDEDDLLTVLTLFVQHRDAR